MKKYKLLSTVLLSFFLMNTTLQPVEALTIYVEGADAADTDTSDTEPVLKSFTNYFGYDGKMETSTDGITTGYYELADGSKVYFDNSTFGYTTNPELTTSYLSMTYGSNATITTKEPVYLASYASSNPKVATVSDTGLVTATGIGTATITVTLAASYCTTVTRTCMVSVGSSNESEPYLAAVTSQSDNNGTYTGSELTRAATLTKSTMSQPFMLYAVNASNAVFASSNPMVATVDATGLVTPVQAGTCTIYASVTNGIGNTLFLSCNLTITAPQISQTSVSVSQTQISSSKIDISGITKDSSVFYVSNDRNIVSPSYFYNNGNAYLELNYYGTGTTTIALLIDDVPFSITVTVENTQINTATATLYPGMTTKLEITGTQSPVKWVSQNTSIATVNSTGLVTGKKAGNVVIEGIANNTSYYSFISVCPKKSYLALQTALSVLGSPYSQPKRMQKGYYDCSSLVWRCYHANGVNIGSSTYAPTAAEQARILGIKKKVISTKSIKSNEFRLRPGDLIFYSKKTKKNGRYKNIYHVAMFAGYTYEGTPSGTLSECQQKLTANICDADGTQVSLRTHEGTHGNGKNIVVVARPLSK